MKQKLESSKLKANEHAKMGYYSSLYSWEYDKARAKYESERKNWTIETLGEGYYLVIERVTHINEDGSKSTKNNETKIYFTHHINGCDCKFYLDHEVGTCPHIESVKRIQTSYKDRCKKVIWINHGLEAKLYRTSNGRTKEITPQEIPPLEEEGFVVIPGVREYLEKKLAPNAIKEVIFEREELNVFKEEGVDLRNYQLDSIQSMLKNGRNILTLKMGLGKTICALACTKLLSNSVLNKNPHIIIVCPNTLKYQWKQEIERFNLGTSFIVTKGTDFPLYEKEPTNFLIVNYEVLNRNREFLYNKHFEIAIIDEIQKIKNGESKTWETISQLQSEYMFALSGTPIQNNISDLISIIRVLNPTKFNPEWKFYQQYCTLTRTRVAGFNPKKLNTLKKELSEYIINPKIDYSMFPLPSKEEYIHKVKMDNVQAQIHEYNLNGAKILLAKSMNKPLTFSEKAILNSYLLKARRAVTDGRLVGGKNPGERVKKVVEIINEIIKEGKKIVVYSEWIDTLKLIKEELRDTEYVEFTGNVPNKLRAKNLGRFILEDNVKVFLSTDSGGLGVDGLQLASHHVIHMEDLWNPMKMEQRNGRLVRMLQSSDVVYVHRFTSESGVEDMLTNANNRKYGIIEDMFGVGK